MTIEVIWDEHYFYEYCQIEPGIKTSTDEPMGVDLGQNKMGDFDHTLPTTMTLTCAMEV